MAARKDQGLQISLIIFVFLFVVFAAMSYLFYRSSSDAKARVAELETQKRDSDNKASKQSQDDKDFRQMMGFGEVDNAEDVKKTFDDDMKRFGGDPSSGSYRTVLDAVFKAKEETEGREAAAKQQVKDLKDRHFLHLLSDAVHGIVYDSLSHGLLALPHQTVDELADELAVVAGIGFEDVLARSELLVRHDRNPSVSVRCFSRTAHAMRNTPD